MPLAVRTRLGPYEVLELLGAGGMGEVYRARDPRLGREVAVKVLPERFVARADHLQRFEREARAAGALNHPNILTVYDVGSDEGRPYIVSELLDGTSLADLVALEAVGLRRVLDLGLQLARGLGCAHGAGILHRDLKPANVFVTRDGRVKILDFGLAKLVRPEGGASPEARTATADTGTEGPVGTAAYMSPEQVRDEPLDERADLFAAGAILYELLSRRRAFAGATESDTFAAILRDDPPALAAVGVSVPLGVETIVRRCLEKRREDRFGSARELATALETLLETVGAGAGREEVEETRPYPGLRSFTEQDAGVFFGREAEVEALWAKLHHRRLLAVIGASGSGKTSFVRAGVVAHRPAGWSAIVCTPSNAPLVMIGQALAGELAADPEALRQLVRFEDPAVAVETVARWRRQHGHVLLVIDQFEELFTLNAPDVAEHFAAFVSRLVEEAGAHVLLSLRDDFLIRCHEHGGLRAVFTDITPLGSLSGEALRRAVVEPALRLGFRFEDERLVDELIGAVDGERAALPLLAFAISRLWDLRDRQRRLITRRAYDELGGVAGALARHAERTVERIGPDRQAIVRELFRNLVTADGTRAVPERHELLSVFKEGRAAGAVLDELIDARLLTSYDMPAAEGQPARRRVEIVHESLLKAWPRLVRWRAQDADGALLRDQLRQAARLWDERGRPSELLWTGQTYREFQLWRERYGGALTEMEQRFATAMIARAQRRRRRRRLAAVAAFAVLMAVSCVIGVLWRRSELSRQRADHERVRAEASKLLALGRLKLEDDPTTALAYATRSLELADTTEARRFALDALWSGPVAFVLPLPPGQWWNLGLSPDASRLAVSSMDDDVLVFPSSGAAPLALEGLESGGRRTVAFAGSDLLVTKLWISPYARDPLRVWEIPSRALLHSFKMDPVARFRLARGRVFTFTPIHGELMEGENRLESWSVRDGTREDLGRVQLPGFPPIAVDPSGRWLASGRGTQVVLRSLAGRAAGRERVVAAHSEKVTGVGFGSGHRLWSLGESGEIRVWSLDPATAGPLRTFHGQPIRDNPETSIRLGEKAAFLIVRFDRERSLRLWEMGAPREAEPLVLRPAGEVQGVFEFDVGRTKGGWVSATALSAVLFWPLPAELPRVLVGHTDRVSRVTFGPDGKWLASGSWDGTVRIWPLDARVAPAARVVKKEIDPVSGLAVDRVRGRVLASTAGKSAFVVDPFAGTPPRALQPGPPRPQGAAFDVQGTKAAISALWSPVRAEKVIRIWDLTNGRVLKELGLLGPHRQSGDPFEGGVIDVEFAADGRLYTAGSGGVRRWDVEHGSWETVVSGRWVRMALNAGGRFVLTATHGAAEPFPGLPSIVRFHDLQTGTGLTLDSHGSDVIALALDPTSKIAVTGSFDGTVRAGPVTGEEPHLFFGHKGPVYSVAVSPDGRWIASAGQDGTIRLWPMPDVSKPPLQALPHAELIARLKSLTNLRVVDDRASATGHRVDAGPFPGWATAPSW